MADRGPPGGEPARASVDEVVLEAAAESPPDSGPEFTGEAGRADDWGREYGQHCRASKGEQRHENVLLTCCCSRESLQLCTYHGGKWGRSGDGGVVRSAKLCHTDSILTKIKE